MILLYLFYFRCTTPNVALLPNMANRTSTLSRLSIGSEFRNQILGYINLTFFNCQQFKSCAACVDSSFPCKWCLESSQCVNAETSDSSCRGEKIIRGKMVSACFFLYNDFERLKLTQHCILFFLSVAVLVGKGLSFVRSLVHLKISTYHQGNQDRLQWKLQILWILCSILSVSS